MQLEFYGAAAEVTGSCHIVRVRDRTLLVDCGLIQGGRDASRRNREPFPFDPRAVDAVLLTHAHIDHSGRLPLLVERGFDGPIHATPATRDLLAVLLRDSAYLNERDAARVARRYGADDPDATPLYDREAVERTLRLVRTFPYDVERSILPGVTVRLRDAGHILGSASVELTLDEGDARRTIVYSGDLGQYDSPILRDPHRFEAADVIVMESTYGDRLHRERAQTVTELGGILAEAAAGGGNIVIPAFAVGRSQELLYLLGEHYDEWSVARFGLFLDSPMAIEASDIYWRHVDLHDDEALRLRERFSGMPPLPNLELCRTADESRALNNIRGGAIIIAGSGMLTGGRVLHHLVRNLPRPECHVVITGFQAPGTLGREIVDGAKEVRILGDEVRVAAAVHTVGGLSAHGDQDDLLRWYSSFARRPHVYLVHGEREPAHALASRIARSGGKATVVKPGLRLDLRDDARAPA